MNYKQYLEEHHGWVPVAANARTHSVTYTFKNRRGEVLTMECLPTQETILIWGSEKRTIPNADDISKALGKHATENDLLRIFDQVLERMEDAQKTSDRREIEGAFKRHSRQKM